MKGDLFFLFGILHLYTILLLNPPYLLTSGHKLFQSIIVSKTIIMSKFYYSEQVLLLQSKDKGFYIRYLPEK